MSFTNFRTGHSHAFGGTYVELTPHQRIRYTDKFEDPSMPREMQIAFTLHETSCGTEIGIVQENGLLRFLWNSATSAGKSRFLCRQCSSSRRLRRGMSLAWLKARPTSHMFEATLMLHETACP